MSMTQEMNIETRTDESGTYRTATGCWLTDTDDVNVEIMIDAVEGDHGYLKIDAAAQTLEGLDAIIAALQARRADFAAALDVQGEL